MENDNLGKLQIGKIAYKQVNFSIFVIISEPLNKKWSLFRRLGIHSIAFCRPFRYLQLCYFFHFFGIKQKEIVKTAEKIFMKYSIKRAISRFLALFSTYKFIQLSSWPRCGHTDTTFRICQFRMFRFKSFVSFKYVFRFKSFASLTISLHMISLERLNTFFCLRFWSYLDMLHSQPVKKYLYFEKRKNLQTGSPENREKSTKIEIENRPPNFYFSNTSHFF